MTMSEKTTWLSGLLALSLALAACASAEPTTQVTPAQLETVTTLAFNPADGSLLKADAAGLFRLAADAQAWQTVQTPTTSGLTGVVINPDDPETLYASGMGAGVLKSTDGGQSWSQVNNGLATADASALAMHSSRRQTLYVWLSGEGMYRTEDGGAHWSRLPDQGPPDPNVQGLVHSNLPGSMNTGWLYAATPSGAFLSMDCF